MNFRKTLFVLLVLTLAFSITACDHSDRSINSNGKKEPIKIGFVGPLTGDLSNMGIPAHQAVELAVEDINQSGGIVGAQIELTTEDGQCAPKEGFLAGNKLINNDQVSVIIGGLCSSETKAIIPIAEESKTILFSYCSSNPQITNMGDYIFRNFPSDNFQGKFAADYIYNKLNIKKVAILNCNEDYCLGIKDVFKKIFANYGGKIVVGEQFESDSKDFKTQFIKIKDTDAQLIYSPALTSATINLLKQAGELNINIPFFGGDAWDDPIIVEQANNSAEGIMWTTTRVNLSEWFKDKMREKYDLETIPNCVPQAYDAVNIIAAVMRKVGTNPEDIKNELYNIKNYPGVSGVISFDQNGDLENAEYVVKTVKDGKVVEHN